MARAKGGKTGRPFAERGAALNAGLKHYTTGRPCVHGHLCERTSKDAMCVECARVKARKFRTANVEFCRARDRTYAQTNAAAMAEKKRLWDLANPGANAARARAWGKDNPERVLEHSRNRRALKRSAEGSHTAGEIAELVLIQRGKCANCRCSIKKSRHVDHIMPLALGGRNDIGNIQLLCPPCNMRKHKKHPIVWAQEEGRLL